MVIISTYLGRQIDLRGFLLETNPQPGSDLKHFAMSVLLRGMAKDIFRQEEQRNRCIFRHGFCHLIGEIGGEDDDYDVVISNRFAPDEFPQISSRDHSYELLFFWQMLNIP